MRIASLKFIPLAIPFVAEFTHASASRNFSDSFLIKIITDGGLAGYGESLVRSYVTGESVHDLYSALPVLAKIIGHYQWQLGPITSDPKTALLSIAQNLDQLFEILEMNKPAYIISYNGLRCAIELAILDGLLREKQQSLNLILPANKKEVVYSAIISANGLEKSLKITRHFKQLGFRDYKLKVTSCGDISLVQKVRELIGDFATLRLDANSSFSLQDSFEFVEGVKPYHIAAIEQPFPRLELAAMTELQNKSNIPIMADESLITLEDAKILLETNAAKFFNIRLAKCGGIYKTVELADFAKTNNIPMQLGCLVGETALLSAVGRYVSAYLTQSCYTEGSFGTLLLQQDISKQSIRFGFRGKAPLLRGIGFGIDIDESILDKFSLKDLILELQCPNT